MPHGGSRRGALRKVTHAPALAAILRGENVPAGGRTVHTLGTPLVKGNGEHSALWLDAHVHPSPVQAAVGAAEQDTDVALEARTCGDPDGLRIPLHLADVAAVGLSPGTQRLAP